MNIYKIMPRLSEIPTNLHRVMKQERSAKQTHVINAAARYYEIVFEDLKTMGERS